MTRFGPAKLGEARSDHTRSHRRLTPRGLDEERGVPDEADPDRTAVDPGRRTVNLGARRPFGPFRATARQLPAQEVGDAPRWRAVWIMKAGAVEVVGHRPFVVAGE